MLVTWKNLHEQFGWNYGRLRKFREVFGVAVRQVLAVYTAARVGVDEHGLTLKNSQPPVVKTQVVVPKQLH